MLLNILWVLNSILISQITIKLLCWFIYAIIQFAGEQDFFVGEDHQFLMLLTDLSH